MSLVQIMNTSQLKLTTRGALLAVSVALTGCATPPPPAQRDPIDESISAAIKRSTDVPKFTESSIEKPQPAVLSGSKLSMVYVGDALTLLPKIAAANKLNFSVVGPEPRLPLFIQISAKEAPLEHVLRDIAMQFGQRASLALTDKSIEVRYNGVTTPVSSK